jgi:alpha-mannosidase
VLQDASKGLALVNTGVYGVEVRSGTFWSTLLRAPFSEYAGMVPDDTSSQHGDHEFNFAIVPFAGGWQKSAVLKEAQEVNSPLHVYVLDAGQGKSDGSFFKLIGDTVVLSTIKRTEDNDGDIVVRMYETAGQRTDASLRIAGLNSAWESDLREIRGLEIQSKGDILDLSFEPFEIKTLRISRNSK